jgi:hypothetical protein
MYRLPLFEMHSRLAQLLLHLARKFVLSGPVTDSKGLAHTKEERLPYRCWRTFAGRYA